VTFLLCSRQIFQQILLDVGDGVGLRGVARDRVAIGVHQELSEVPLDEVAHQTTLLLLQELPKRVGSLPVHLDLGKHVKLGPVVQGKLLDLLVSSRLLRAELVAGETKDGQPRAVLLVKLRQLGVVHGSQTSLGRHVHDQHRAAPVLLHGDGLAIDAGAAEVVYRLWRRHAGEAAAH